MFAKKCCRCTKPITGMYTVLSVTEICLRRVTEICLLRNFVDVQSLLLVCNYVCCAECYGDMFAKKFCRCSKPITGTYTVLSVTGICLLRNAVDVQSLLLVCNYVCCAECYGDMFAEKSCRCTKPITGYIYCAEC